MVPYMKFYVSYFSLILQTTFVFENLHFHKFYEFKIVHAGMNFIKEKQALLFKSA